MRQAISPKRQRRKRRPPSSPVLSLFTPATALHVGCHFLHKRTQFSMLRAAREGERERDAQCVEWGMDRGGGEQGGLPKVGLEWKMEMGSSCACRAAPRPWAQSLLEASPSLPSSLVTPLLRTPFRTTLGSLCCCCCYFVVSFGFNASVMAHKLPL